jgi:hypothetical protein
MSLEAPDNADAAETASGYAQALAVEMVVVTSAIAQVPLSKPRTEWLSRQVLKQLIDTLKRLRREKN